MTKMVNLYVSKDSLIERFASDKQTFFAKWTEVPEPYLKAVLDFEAKALEYRKWLRRLEGALASNNEEQIVTVLEEIPAWVVTAEVKKERRPKKQATEAPSSSESQKRRKKLGSKSTTSRKKAS